MQTDDEAVQPLLRIAPFLTAIGLLSLILLIFWGQW